MADVRFPLTLRALDLAINQVKARSIEEAERRGSLVLERDEKSGGYIVRLAGGEE